jgi:prolyl oligopeptidase
MSDSRSILTYPKTHKSDQVDDYHGIKVSDPYRWLEDLDGEETKAWVDAQNQVTFGYLEKIQVREKIKQRLTQVWNYEKYGTPFQQGNRYFYFKNDGLQNQSVLYVLDSLDAEPEVLIDPNTLSEDGTIALSNISISEDGNLMAYGLSTSGSDWQEWKVRDIQTKTDLEDHLKWIKFSGASWTHDHKGFFYSRYDEPKEENKLEDTNYYQKLYYHRLGTLQSEDQLIYERSDQKEWGFSGYVTEDGKYLIISVWRGTDPRNLIFYKDLTQPNSEVIELIKEFEAEYGFIDYEGDKFWFQTDLDAPKSRVIAIDINTGNQTEIISEAEETLQGVGLLNNQFVTSYLKDAYTQIKIFNLDGSFIKAVELPGIGSAGGFSGKRHDTETFYSYTSFTTPNNIYRYNMVTGRKYFISSSRSGF